jgi:polynucleotide 5'-hydroxyl-kinase GRC3/NOL9
VTLSRGLATCTVDGDIGQGDLAPPASIGAAALSEPLTDLRDEGAGLYEFVGITSPAGFEQIVAGKLKSILERARPLGDICIVNTDGYVRGRGVQYKQMLARELQPDAIICLENPELLDAFKGGPWQVIHARASSQVSKTKYERKNRRLDQFLRHIGSGLSDADLSQVKFVHMDRVFSQPDLSRPAIIQLEPENMKRMFVGLGKDGQVVGFGLVVGIADDRIFVRTDVESFDSIYLSDIRLGKGRIVEIRIA